MDGYGLWLMAASSPNRSSEGVSKTHKISHFKQIWIQRRILGTPNLHLIIAKLPAIIMGCALLIGRPELSR